MGTKIKSFAERRFPEIVKKVTNNWGSGWHQLGASMQEHLIQSAVFAELHGAARMPNVDPEVFLMHARELGEMAMGWQGEQS